MSKSYRVTLHQHPTSPAPFALGSCNLITYVEAHNELSAAIAAVCAHPGWYCNVSDVQCIDAPALDAKSTAHVDRSGATVQMENGAVLHFTSGAADPLRGVGDRRWWPITDEPSNRLLRRAMAAIATCEHLGYTFEGGEQWKPPSDDVLRDRIEAWFADGKASGIEWAKSERNQDGYDDYYLDGVWRAVRFGLGLK